MDAYTTPLGRYLQEHNLTIVDMVNRSGVSYTTLFNVVHGKIRITRYDVAARISKATGERVSIEDLCEGPTDVLG